MKLVGRQAVLCQSYVNYRLQLMVFIPVQLQREVFDELMKIHSKPLSIRNTLD